MSTSDAPAARPAPAITHWVPYDAPGRRLARARCGALVDRDRDHCNEPTCHTCARLTAEYEALEI